MALGNKMELRMKHGSKSDNLYARRDIIEDSDEFSEAGSDSNPAHLQIQTDEALGAAMPGLQKFRECIVKSYAYEWLLNDLQRHCFLASSGPNLMAEVSDAILLNLSMESHSSKRESAIPFKMTYAMEWNLVQFLEDQEYIETNSQALSMVITLTGSRKAAQALTCSQYLHQTWPFSGGKVLNLLQSLLGPEKNGRAKGEMARKTTHMCISTH